MKKNPTLSLVLKKYGEYQRRKGSPETVITRYNKDISNIFEWIWKIENWQKTTAEEIEKYIRKQKRKPNTQATKSHQIRSFFKFCRIKGLKTIENYQILPVKTVLKEAKFLRENEIEKIKNYVEKNLKYKAIIQLFLTTGVRLAEICTITNEQIEKAINLGEVYQINIIGKGSKLRSIFPPVETIELCKNLKNKGETVIGWQKRRVSNLMRRISKATKISFTAHTLRHTYLSNLARKWADIYRIQKIAGHSSITTTSLYLHCTNKELAETASLICRTM